MQFEHFGKRKPAAKQNKTVHRATQDEVQPTSSRLAPPLAEAAQKRPFAFLFLPDGRVNKKTVSLLSVSASAVVLAVILLLMVLVLPGCRQTPPAASASASSSASLPVSSYDQTLNILPVEELSGTVLEETEDAGEEYVEETLFLGDSNTVRLVEFSSVTGITLQNGIGVVGEGIQGAVSNRNIIFSGYNNVTMAESVAMVQPRRVVITFGTNNAGYTSTEAFIEYYEAFIEAIQTSYEYADIIIAAVPPIAQSHTNQQLSMTEIDKYNVALGELAKELDIKFLNWSEVLKDENTGFAKSGTMEGDGIHITRSAAESMMRYFRTHSYITDDERPPLKSVPQHIQTPAPVVSSSQAPAASSSSVSVLESSSLPSSLPASTAPIIIDSTVPDPNAQPDPNVQPQPDPNAPSDPNAQPQPDPNAQPQPDPNAQPQPDPNAQPQLDPNAQPDPNAV